MPEICKHSHISKKKNKDVLGTYFEKVPLHIGKVIYDT